MVDGNLKKPRRNNKPIQAARGKPAKTRITIFTINIKVNFIKYAFETGHRTPNSNQK